MKSTIIQPWATLIALNEKKFETRAHKAQRTTRYLCREED